METTPPALDEVWQVVAVRCVIALHGYAMTD